VHSETVWLRGFNVPKVGSQRANRYRVTLAGGNWADTPTRPGSVIPGPKPRHDKEALEFDITHCRFAEFFRALGEPELGALLICETDFDIAAAGSGEVSFTRDQTIMQGAPSCMFRYKFAPR